MLGHLVLLLGLLPLLLRRVYDLRLRALWWRRMDRLLLALRFTALRRFVRHLPRLLLLCVHRLRGLGPLLWRARLLHGSRFLCGSLFLDACLLHGDRLLRRSLFLGAAALRGARRFRSARLLGRTLLLRVVVLLSRPGLARRFRCLLRRRAIARLLRRSRRHALTLRVLARIALRGRRPALRRRRLAVRNLPAVCVRRRAHVLLLPRIAATAGGLRAVLRGASLCSGVRMILLRIRRALGTRHDALVRVACRTHVLRIRMLRRAVHFWCAAW